MNFKTHNDKEIPFVSSCLQGYIFTSYDELVGKLGEPTEGDGHKTDAEWDLEFEDGTFANIYNWKNGKNYNGSDGQELEDITEWNIGGISKTAVQRVKSLFPKARTQTSY